MNADHKMLVLVGVVAAAVIPMIVSRLGVSTFWSQAAGIASAWLLMLAGFSPPREWTATWFLRWAVAASIATLIAFTLQRVTGLA